MFALAMAGVLAGAAACGGSSSGGSGGAAGGGDKSTFTIPIIAPFSGDTAAFGQSYDRGSQIALDEVHGAINGRPIKFTNEDDQCAPQNGALAFQKVADSASVILGSPCTGSDLAILPLLKKRGVPLVNGGLSEALGQAHSPYQIQAAQPTSQALGAILGYAKAQGASSIGVLLDDTSYSQSGKPVISQIASSLGIKVTGFYQFSANENQFSSYLLRAQRDHPDALLAYGYDVQGGELSHQAAQLGIKLPLYGTDQFNSPAFLKAAGTSAEGRTYVPLASSTEPKAVVRNFVAAFQAKFGEKPSSVDIEGYTGAKVIFEALKSLGTNWTPSRINQALHSMTFDTAMGSLKFDQWGNPSGTDAVIETIKNGEPTFVKYWTGQ